MGLLVSTGAIIYNQFSKSWFGLPSVSRKIIITKTLTPMDEFEFSIDPTAGDFADTFKTIGIDPENLRLSLYFIPDNKITEDEKK